MKTNRCINGNCNKIKCPTNYFVLCHHSNQPLTCCDWGGSAEIQPSCLGTERVWTNSSQFYTENCRGHVHTHEDSAVLTCTFVDYRMFPECREENNPTLLPTLGIKPATALAVRCWTACAVREFIILGCIHFKR